MTFNKIYFLAFILLFLIEVLIERYATGFIRHTIGDYLVVILLYAFSRSFIKLSVNKTALMVLIIAFIIEFLQITSMQNHFPPKHSKMLNLIFGTSFSLGDLVAYTAGIITVILIEKYLKRGIKKT